MKNRNTIAFAALLLNALWGDVLSAQEHDGAAEDAAFRLGLEARIGTPSAPDLSASSDAGSPLLSSMVLLAEAQVSLPADWGLRLRLPFVAIGVLQPGGSTVTERRLGNVFVDASKRWSRERGAWRLLGELSFGVGVPSACAGSGATNCGSAMALASAMSGWAEAELFATDALPLAVGYRLFAESGRLRLALALRAGVMLRFADDAAAQRRGRPFGAGHVVRIGASVRAASWLRLGLDAVVAGWLPALTRPVGASSTQGQFSLNPSLRFGLGNNLGLTLGANIGVAGALANSYAISLGLELAL